MRTFNIYTGAWRNGLCVRLAVRTPGFDFLAKSDQKTLKVGIHSFSAWRLAIKTNNVKLGRQVRLIVESLGKAFNRIVSIFEWLDW